MKRNQITQALLIFSLLLCGAPLAQAQDISGETDREGAAGSAFLLVPVTAQTVALGSATGASLDMNGLEALTANPGNLVLNSGTSALFSRMSYVADIGINHFGVAQQIGVNQLALTVTSWDFGDIPVTRADAPEADPNVTYSPANIVVGLSYARLFTDRISGGLSVKAINQSIGDDLSASTVAFDIGMAYDVGTSGLRFGISLKNLAPAMAFSGDGLQRTGDIQEDASNEAHTLVYEAADFELPTVLNFGGSYTRPIGGAADMTVIANFQSDSYFDNDYSLGLEVGVMDVIDLRGSYVYTRDIGANFYGGWNLGAGLNLDLAGAHLIIDYAYRMVDIDVFGNVQIITASVSL